MCDTWSRLCARMHFAPVSSSPESRRNTVLHCVADYLALVTVRNHDTAPHLEENADLPAAQNANPFCVLAYRNGALALRNMQPSARNVFEEQPFWSDRSTGSRQVTGGTVRTTGENGPHSTSRSPSGETDAEQAFATVAGIGPEMPLC